MAHARTKGQRDFSSVRQLVATHYDLIARGGTVDRARSMLSEAGCCRRRKRPADPPGPAAGRGPALTVPVWAWATFLAFVIAMLALDVFVLHRKAHEVSLREAGIWSAVWIVHRARLRRRGVGLGGRGTAQAYLAGYLIEKSLSVDNIFLFAAIFSAFAIPARYQHRVLMFGIIGALVMRAAFIAAGITLLEAIHPVIYVFGAVLLLAAFNMLRGGTHAPPEQSRVLRWLRRRLPVTDELHGQRFLLRDGGRLLATPLLLALVVVETTDVIFAVDSIPAILAVTTDPFVVYTSNVFALLGMRALYFLLAGAAGRLRYLRPGLAVILGGRRGQAAARRRLGVPRLVGARVHHRRAGRRRRRVPPRRPPRAPRRPPRGGALEAPPAGDRAHGGGAPGRRSRPASAARRMTSRRGGRWTAARASPRG